MYRCIGLCLVMWLAASNSMAQLSFDVPKLASSAVLKRVKPLNLNFHHSYSMEYSSSSWGSGLSGTYLNTMDYRFKVPVSLSLTWGIRNVFSGYDQNASPRFVLPRLDLRWQPYKSLWIELHYRHITTPYYSPFDSDIWGHDDF